jgi:hypothetical protein
MTWKLKILREDNTELVVWKTVSEYVDWFRVTSNSDGEPLGKLDC